MGASGCPAVTNPSELGLDIKTLTPASRRQPPQTVAVTSRSGSKDDLQRELFLARCSTADQAVIRAGNRRPNTSKVRVHRARGSRSSYRQGGANAAIGIPKVRMVKDIEKVGTELDRHSLLHGEVLHQGEIPLEEAWCAQTVPSHRQDLARDRH